jgi:hypothetical protein
LQILRLCAVATLAERGQTAKGHLRDCCNGQWQFRGRENAINGSRKIGAYGLKSRPTGFSTGGKKPPATGSADRP